MTPELVRTLLATSAENLPRVAKRMEVPLPIARDIRVQAINLVLGRCMLCGKPTLAGLCPHCKKNASHRTRLPWTGKGFLESLKPSDQLLRQTCEDCGNTFMLSASFLLRRLGSNKSRVRCKRCADELLKRCEEQKRLEAIEDARRRARARKELLQQPFAGHEALLKLKNQLKKTPLGKKRGLKPLHQAKMA